MAKNNIDNKEYKKFINDVADKVIHQAEEDDKMEDLVENAAEMVKSDPIFKEKILHHVLSNSDLRKELKDKIIDDMCD